MRSGLTVSRSALKESPMATRWQGVERMSRFSKPAMPGVSGTAGANLTVPLRPARNF